MSKSLRTKCETDVKALGKWRDYVLRRDGLKDSGVSVEDAWRVAYTEITGKPPTEEAAAITPQIPSKAFSPLLLEMSEDAKWRELRGNDTSFQAMKDYLQYKVGSRNSPTTQVINWVFNAVGKDLTQLTSSEIPSLGALRLWEWARNPQNYGDFLQQMFSKTIPSKQQIEMEDKLRDNGKKSLDIISAALKEYVKQDEPEDSPTQGR